MEHIIHKNQGVCSRSVEFDLEGNKIFNIKFVGGCPGNLLGISALVDGKSIDEIIERLKGTKCGSKATSCPDQLAIALENVKLSKTL